MKHLKDFFQVVATGKAPSQICSFDAKAGWGQVNSPFSISTSLPKTHEDLVGELKKTHETFWGSCECCGDEGVILYRPLAAARKDWLAYVKGRGSCELVPLSDFASAMEFMRRYAPVLISIPDLRRVARLLEEMLEGLSTLEPSQDADASQ